MPDIVSDIVDVYVFRRLNARVQFLLLQRKQHVPLGNTWQSFHTQIQGHESTIDAARRAVRDLAGLVVSEAYSADYINEFFDDTRDMVVLAPVLAVQVSPQAPVTLGPELRECGWWDTNQAVARLPFAGQRWAVRHIDEIMGVGLAESQLYRLQLPTNPASRSRVAVGEVSVPGDDLDESIAAAKVDIDSDGHLVADDPDSVSDLVDVDRSEVQAPSTRTRLRTDVPGSDS